MAKKKKATKKKAAQKKIKNKPVSKETDLKICNRCGYENQYEVDQCEGCNSTKFAPKWVLAKRPVNRQVGVEITKSNPNFGRVQKRITLSKWWPGGSATFHIPNIGQWSTIGRIINDELGPLIGWKTKKELVEAIKGRAQNERKLARDIRKLVGEYPDFLKQVVASIDTSKLGKDDMEKLITVLGDLADAVANANTGFSKAFISVVKKLPKQKQKALEELEILLESWSLHQITSVAQEVKRRLETIQLFKTQILDDRTYEIRGDKSIHRILEKAMWLIDERYWLLQSNSTLRTLIGETMAKKDRRQFAKKRPDFVCGTVGEKLIIIEIKRPSRTLGIDDLNQLETYLTVAEEHFSYRGYEAYLVGRRKDSDLLRRLKHRATNFKVLTYSELVSSSETRYREYINNIEER
ncbi:MAG: hypothetical protein ACYSYT_06635 [Planctomycetota bacterium]|jgi:hypothetical protein